MRHLIVMGLFSLAALSLVAEAKNPVEVGKVKWLRDYEAALAQAKKSKKPVAILFQEAPG